MARRPYAGRPASLAHRVTILLALVIILCFLTLAWVVPRFVAHHFAEQDVDEIRAVAQSVDLALKGKQIIVEDAATARRLSGAVAGHHGIYFAVLTPKGRLLYETTGANLARIASTIAPTDHVSIDTVHEWTDGQHGYRGAVLRMPGPAGEHYTVVVAAATDFHARFIAGFRRSLWTILAAVGLLMILATWFAVQHGHSPLHRVSAKIRSIRSDKLSTRLDPADVPTELQELVISFNDMLGRMDEVFQRLSNFAADIAHELRTPITNLTTQAQVALGKARDVKEYRDVLYSSLEEYDRVARMIGDMLWLAKTDSGLIRPEFVEIDLAAEITKLFEFFDALADDSGVALRLEGESPRILGDREMLRRAFGNLLSNAIRYTPKGDAVTVRLSCVADHAVIAVENPGSTIPPGQAERIFERFHRADPSPRRRGEGAGLGLAIVKSIVDLHGGRISVYSTHGICAFAVQLPTAATRR